MIKTFEDQFSKIQTQIIEKYCNLEPSKSCVISDDNWIRKKGGGGRTFIIEKGKFLIPIFIVCAEKRPVLLFSIWTV